MAVYVTGDPNPYNMSEVILTIYNVVVKGYHECPFSVELGECFVAQKKEGRSRERAKSSRHNTWSWATGSPPTGFGSTALASEK